MNEAEDRLNLIRQFNAFNKKRVGVLKPVATALYFALLDVANHADHLQGVRQTIAVDNDRLMRLSGIGNKKTLVAHREELVENGFIEYRKGTHGRTGTYRLVRLY